MNPQNTVAVRPQVFLFVVLSESLIYDFRPSGKIKFVFQFLFLFYAPTLRV